MNNCYIPAGKYLSATALCKYMRYVHKFPMGPKAQKELRAFIKDNGGTSMKTYVDRETLATYDYPTYSRELANKWHQLQIGGKNG